MKRIKRVKKVNENVAVKTISVSAETSLNDQNSDSNTDSKANSDNVEENELSEEQKKQKALEEIDKKDDADIMTMILSGEMSDDADIRERIFKRGSDYIQKQMTGTITPDKQREMYKKILANAGLSEKII